MQSSDTSWSEYAQARSQDQGSLRQYLDTIRERRWFIAAAVVVCMLGAAIYVVTAPKVYEATSSMLVTPIPDAQTGVLGLGLLRGGSDPTAVVATASLLIDNANVAAQVRANLGLSDSPQALLKKISVQPIANSTIVSITASTSSPKQSQQLANAFAKATVQIQTADLYTALDPAIANLRIRIQTLAGTKSAANNAAAQPLYQQLAALEALRSAPNPTLKFETAATLPTSPSSPQKKLALAGGLIGGLLIGIAGAFALGVIDPRRSRLGGLEMTGLSILTRVPVLGRGGRTRHAFDEPFRSLRTSLRFASAENPIGTIAVTSASEKEGKTTTAFQLAMATLEAGQSVLLVEADTFRPGLRSLVDFDTTTSGGPGLLEYLSGTADLDDIVERTSIPGLMFVSAGSHQPTSITGLLEGERGQSFIHLVSGLADVVILDCPPVGPRSDAILVASLADAVVLVVDLQRSTERDVFETVRRLRRAGTELLGIVVNRDNSAGATYEYREQKPKKQSRRGALSPRR